MKNLILAACLAAFAGAVSAEGDAKRGAALYQVYCTQCHGVNGDGKGVNAAHMAVMPRDHTDAKEMSARTDEELFAALPEDAISVHVGSGSTRAKLRLPDPFDLRRMLRAMLA